MKNLRIRTFAFVTMAALIGPAWAAGDDDADNDAAHKDTIVIVDQDGQEVDGRQLKIKTSDDDGGKPTAIKVEDGKIIVIDKNGEKREIDVSGAKSIIVNQSVKSIMRDGEQEQQVQGKAIIIGPDGKRQEIDLGGEIEGGRVLAFPAIPEVPGLRAEGFRLPLRLHASGGTASKYMIGVHCEPVSDSLRVHLDLAEGAGLIVVTEPEEGTPATKAGIKQHDILMSADESELKAVADLVKAVDGAGKEKRSISITLVRGGKEQSVTVEPVERPEEQFGFHWRDGDQLQGLQLDRIGPGIIMDEKFDGDFAGQFEDMRAQLKEQMDKMNQQMELMEQQLKEAKEKHEADKDQERD
jgi:hypothetical protein